MKRNVLGSNCDIYRKRRSSRLLLAAALMVAQLAPDKYPTLEEMRKEDLRRKAEKEKKER